MRHRYAIAIMVATFLSPACSREEPAAAAPTPSAAESAAADMQRKHNDEATELDGKIADLNRRWSETETKLATNTAAVTRSMRAEIKEDLGNVSQAVADLRTTDAANWWERHERAMERTASDIEADVRRLTKKKTVVAPAAENAAAAAPFESRRDQFVTRLRARIEHMEDHLEGVRARGAMEAELNDTRARVEKLKDDAERLGKASPDDWWDLSAKRVREYIDRVDESIERVDDTKK